jgi:hypothetical protein
MLAEAKKAGDKAKQQKIKQEQKYAKCRQCRR